MDARSFLSTAALAGMIAMLPATAGATYGQHLDVFAPMSLEAKQARKSYQARRADQNRKLNTQAQQTRKALFAVVVAVQASCEGSCVAMP